MVFGEKTRWLPNPPDYIFLYFTPYSVPPFGRGDSPGNVFFSLADGKKEGKRKSQPEFTFHQYDVTIVVAVKSSKKVNNYPVIR